jgi:threonine synthase
VISLPLDIQLFMSTTELQSQLHKVIDQVTDQEILKAVHTLLTSQLNVYAHTANGKAITKEELDLLLAAAEEEIREGKTTTAYDLKNEIKSWRKK